MYKTIEVEIDRGHVIPVDAAELPEHAHALVVIIPPPGKRQDWSIVRAQLGWLNATADAAEWERKHRAEWDRAI